MATVRWCVVMLLLAACSGSTAASSTIGQFDDGDAARFNAGMERLRSVPEPLRGSILTWVNTNGLAQLDPLVWQERLDRTCDAEFWNDPAALVELGDEFVASDLALSVGADPAEPIDMVASYQALWVMALNHCRELVPVGAVEAGPPQFGGISNQ